MPHPERDHKTKAARAQENSSSICGFPKSIRFSKSETLVWPDVEKENKRKINKADYKHISGYKVISEVQGWIS